MQCTCNNHKYSMLSCVGTKKVYICLPQFHACHACSTYSAYVQKHVTVHGGNLMHTVSGHGRLTFKLMIYTEKIVITVGVKSSPTQSVLHESVYEHICVKLNINFDDQCRICCCDGTLQVI